MHCTFIIHKRGDSVCSHRAQEAMLSITTPSVIRSRDSSPLTPRSAPLPACPQARAAPHSTQTTTPTPPSIGAPIRTLLPMCSLTRRSPPPPRPHRQHRCPRLQLPRRTRRHRLLALQHLRGYPPRPPRRAVRTPLPRAVIARLSTCTVCTVCSADPDLASDRITFACNHWRLLHHVKRHRSRGLPPLPRCCGGRYANPVIHSHT